MTREQLMVAALFYSIAFTVVGAMHVMLLFKSRRLSREVERLENERKSLIHRVNVQREMMHDLASGDVGKKLNETFTDMNKLGSTFLECLKLYRIAHELEGKIRENRENKQV